MIAGEGLMGILLAFLAVLGIDKLVDISAYLPFSGAVSTLLGVILLALMVVLVLKFSIFKKSKGEKDVK